MPLLSPLKGVDMWLKKHNYIGKKSGQAASIVKEYIEATGNTFDTSPCFTLGGKRVEQQAKQFKLFTRWVKLNKKQLNN